jgi:hemolysin activation/secretion protein
MTHSTAFALRGISAAALLCLSGLAHAQTSVPDAGSVLRNIEQGLPQAQPLVTPAPLAAPASSNEISLGKLVGVQVESTFFPDEIQAYWLPSMNKGVSAAEIGRFKAWLWEQLQAKGYLAYVATSEEVTPTGSVLKVKVSAPILGRVTVAALDETATDPGSRPYVDQVARRFAKSYTAGAPVDVQGMSARLNAISYDLPVTLEAALRQPDAANIDVVINMRLLSREPGRVSGGLVQLNNHGLKAYGREQILTQVRVQGEEPLTEYGLVAQASEGVAYVSLNRTAAIEGQQSRINLSASASSTQTRVSGVSVRSKTHILGVGPTTLISSSRDSNTLSNLNLSYRHTTSKVGGAVDTKRSDFQLAFNVRMSGTPGWVTGYDAQAGVRLGVISIRSSFDRDARDVKDTYQILETNGELRQNLSEDKRWVGKVSWRAQKAFQNVDSYNQISLGGVNGIRAYTTSDGVGDEGVQVSFDLTHQFSNAMYAGVLYDVGVVRQNIKAVSGVKPAPYSLSGAGVQLGGNKGAWSWNAIMAKGLDKTEPFETAVSEELEKWRGSVALTYRF